MKKCSACKSSSSKKKNNKVTCKICNQKSSCPSKPSGTSLNQKRSDVSTKISSTSFDNKSEKEQNKCSCSKKPNNSSILDMITEDKVCMCQVFANAFRSDIHMNLGTYIHQNESESNSDNIIEYD